MDEVCSWCGEDVGHEPDCPIAAMDSMQAEIELRAQLPETMQHCTIQFKECELGHGWLTATNWVQHGCPTCELKAAKDALENVCQVEHDWRGSSLDYPEPKVQHCFTCLATRPMP